MIQFDHQGLGEFATDRLPFVAVGGGQAIADPFLALLRRIFWPSSPPSAAEGVFAVYWTLHHAILTTPGGVADPKQIAVLEKNGEGELTAKYLTAEELEEPKGWSRTPGGLAMGME